MTAAEQRKAEEAAQRILDMQERLIEAIGELLARRASRKAWLGDHLDDLRITRSDFDDLGAIATMFAESDKDAPNYQAAFTRAAEMDGITTVRELAGAVAHSLYSEAEVAP